MEHYLFKSTPGNTIYKAFQYPLLKYTLEEPQLPSTMKKFLLGLLALAPFAIAMAQSAYQQPTTSENLNTLLQQGRAHLNAGEYDAALKKGNAAVSQAPNNINALTLRGLARSFTNNYRGAILDYTAAVNSTSLPAGNLFLWRAQREEKPEDYTAAADDYRRFLQQKPGDKRGTDALARLDGRQRNAALQAPAPDPNDPNRPFMLSIRKLNADMQSIMDEKVDAFNAIDQLARTKRRLQKGMVELEAFHNPKWPVFKAAYQQTMEKLSVHVKD